MTNQEWLDWFMAQSREYRRDVMRAIDALEAQNINGKLAHETVMVASRAGVHPARISHVLAMVKN